MWTLLFIALVVSLNPLTLYVAAAQGKSQTVVPRQVVKPGTYAGTFTFEEWERVIMRIVSSDAEWASYKGLEITLVLELSTDAGKTFTHLTTRNITGGLVGSKGLPGVALYPSDPMNKDWRIRATATVSGTATWGIDAKDN